MSCSFGPFTAASPDGTMKPQPLVRSNHLTVPFWRSDPAQKARATMNRSAAKDRFRALTAAAADLSIMLATDLLKLRAGGQRPRYSASLLFRGARKRSRAGRGSGRPSGEEQGAGEQAGHGSLEPGESGERKGEGGRRGSDSFPGPEGRGTGVGRYRPPKSLMPGPRARCTAPRRPSRPFSPVSGTGARHHPHRDRREFRRR